MQRLATQRIGIVGGMSWESTLTYYRELNRGYNRRFGGLHSAPLLVSSVDFAPIEVLQRREEWDTMAEILATAARGLERAGVDLLLLATNTMHLVFDQLVAATTVPWIHIADPLGEALVTDRIRRVGLLGTRFTMEREFYQDRLQGGYGLEVIVPTPEDRQVVDGIIFKELVAGILKDESRSRYRRVIEALRERGAQAIALGCTEIGLLVSPADSPLPLYDTTVLHAAAAINRYSDPK